MAVTAVAAVFTAVEAAASTAVVATPADTVGTTGADITAELLAVDALRMVAMEEWAEALHRRTISGE
jgi:hypothetical protein